MMKWGLVYFLLAVASGVLGVADTDGTSAAIAQVFFFGNVVLFVVFTLLGSIFPTQGIEPSLADAKRRRD